MVLDALRHRYGSDVFPSSVEQLCLVAPVSKEATVTEAPTSLALFHWIYLKVD